MTDDPFYRSITGLYESKPKPLPKQEVSKVKNPEEWAETSNKVLQQQNIPKRVIDTDGSQEIYNKKFVGFLIGFSIFAVIALLIIGGVFVYKYKPTNIDQPISVNPNVTVQGDTVNVDATDEINPAFYNDNQATIIIEKVEVTCMDGGCFGDAGGNESG